MKTNPGARFLWLALSLAGFLPVAAFAAAAANAAPTSVFELPPMTVTGAPWVYTEIAGMEILSVASDRTIRNFIQAELREEAAIDRILPREFRADFSVPRAMILADQAMAPTLSRDLLAKSDAIQLRYLSNLRLDDRDAITTFALLPKSGFSWSKLHLSPGFVRLLLERRTPALPAWAIEGFMAAYEDMAATETAIHIQNRFVWRTKEDSARLAHEFKQGAMDGSFHVGRDAVAKTYLKMLPLKEVLEGPSPEASAASPETCEIWQSETALVVRWVLDGGNKEGGDGSRLAGFWKYLARAAQGPVSEGLLKECLGVDYTELNYELRVYLPVALIAPPLHLSFKKERTLPPVDIRFATPAEIARILGGWERLEVVEVKQAHPEFAGPYLKQANTTLLQAYQDGLRDPAALAVVSLYRLDLGEPVAALPLLETAAAAGVVRPRLYFELARLRLEEMRAQAPGPGASLDHAQTAAVLGLLDQARRQQPALAEVYRLANEVWLRSSAVPTPAQLDLLLDGLRSFPRDLNLRYTTTVLLASRGFISEARTSAELGRQLSPDAANRDRFQKILAPLSDPGP